jgi:phage gp36-like protein
MQYLEKTDLITASFERFIDESTLDQVETLDNVEAQNIALIKSYIGSRYDVEMIFDEDEPVKNELITRILVKLCLFDIIRRNAARKVPADFKEEYDKAIELLEKIAYGKLPVSGLPVPTDDDGNPIESTTISGNNTNENFYI